MIEEIKKYQEALNDIINNCKNFNCKNDSFWLIQELIDKYKDKEDKYKKCWEELRSDLEYNTLYAPAFWVMQKIEKENKIEVE